MKNRHWSMVKRVMAGVMAAALLLAAGKVHVSSNDRPGVQVCEDDEVASIERS